MKLQRILFLSLAVIVSLTTTFSRAAYAQEAQASRLYQQMSQDERRAFVAEQARRISREMSGTEYEFTADFEATVQMFVDKYTRRIGNNSGERDARLVFERGVANAPTLISAFKAQGVSPLIGLYLPLIESEYVNLQTPSPMGAIGMFQFLPQTGRRYGLTMQGLLDVERSAAAAARYITDSLKQFKDDPMKEALALLAYNRGGGKTASALQLVLDDQNRRCSICALTAASSRLDATFQKENVHYVPSFFAAAIVGENPQAFGLQQQPLSSYETKR